MSVLKQVMNIKNKFNINTRIVDKFNELIEDSEELKFDQSTLIMIKHKEGNIYTLEGKDSEGYRNTKDFFFTVCPCDDCFNEERVSEVPSLTEACPDLWKVFEEAKQIYMDSLMDEDDEDNDENETYDGYEFLKSINLNIDPQTVTVGKIYEFKEGLQESNYHESYIRVTKVFVDPETNILMVAGLVVDEDDGEYIPKVLPVYNLEGF